MNTIPDDATHGRIDRIGSIIGKAIVLALIALYFWGYSTTFLAQLGFF
jgi:hypothetical protein